MTAPRHPGEVLRDDFMAPIGLEVATLASLSGMSKQRLYELIAGKRGISVDTATRLGGVFRVKPKHWLAMQADWDLAQADRPAGVRRVALPAGYVSGPRGVIRIPATPPPKPVDTSISPEFADAVARAAAILRPFQTSP